MFTALITLLILGSPAQLIVIDLDRETCLMIIEHAPKAFKSTFVDAECVKEQES